MPLLLACIKVKFSHIEAQVMINHQEFKTRKGKCSYEASFWLQMDTWRDNMQEFVQSYKDTQAKLKTCPPEVSDVI